MNDASKPTASNSSESEAERRRADVVASVVLNSTSHRTASTPMPDAEVVAGIVERLGWLAFPGFFGPRVVDPAELERHVGDLLDDLTARLSGQLEAAFAYAPIGSRGCSQSEAATRAVVVTDRFLDRIPAIRELLAEDAAAAFEGDPAMGHLEEAILCCPGLAALVVHRFAHELHLAGVPLVPRMMSEIAHARTGIDMHPGAVVGRRMFIDHGTGVVVGETTRISDGCRLYQGVTLGAKRLEVGEDGLIRRGHRRHPTLEDDVTVYANATILGEDTVIGRGSVVNGGVFLTTSVPPDSVVSGPRLEVHMRRR